MDEKSNPFDGIKIQPGAEQYEAIAPRDGEAKAASFGEEIDNYKGDVEDESASPRKEIEVQVGLARKIMGSVLDASRKFVTALAPEIPEPELPTDAKELYALWLKVNEEYDYIWGLPDWRGEGTILKSDRVTATAAQRKAVAEKRDRIGRAWRDAASGIKVHDTGTELFERLRAPHMIARQQSNQERLDALAEKHPEVRKLIKAHNNPKN